ncbi:MAG: hypothetical protein ABL921_08725 [Pirellula sp.]
MLKRIPFPTLLLAWIAMIALCLLAVCFCNNAQAQSIYSPLPSNHHALLKDSAPPGEIGRIQLLRKPELKCIWQAVEIRGPKGLKINMAEAGQFAHEMPQPARIAVMIGPVYRMRLTGIPLEPDLELFPTLEVIDRTHPPAEREHRFPIPIEIDEDDLECAARGEMVMKVIYLEDNQIADPIDTAGKPQRVMDLQPHQDALRTADQFGRPLAILRIGSRVPNVTDGQDWENFLYGCPAWTTLKPIPTKDQLIGDGKWPITANSGSITDRR